VSPVTLLQRFEQGDTRALARIISFVENEEDGFREALSRLYRKPRHAVRIGLTGPPGAGKSTLVDSISRKLLQAGNDVSVIAVDPSSPFTGGALLGDRVRFKEETQGGKHFFRSMASRGSSGGLSSATDNAALVLDSFGFDFVLIETVGVGQVELDIVNNCDLVAVVLVPESGDAVQTLKAGLTEIADVFVVNKSDRAGADRIVADLTSMLALRNQQKTHPTVNETPHIPVISTDAVRETNLDELVSAFGSLVAGKKDNGEFSARRRRQMLRKVSELLQQRFLKETLQKRSSRGEIDRVVDSILAGKDDPYSTADRLFSEANLSPQSC
jgi:GTPase